MEFSEKKIEELIINAINSKRFDELSSRGLNGLKNYDKFYRQVDLGTYGRLDLVAIKYGPYQGSGNYKYLDVNVIEIKKGEINIGVLLQSIRYCKGIQVLLSKYGIRAKCHITLIGSSICLKSEFCYLTDIMDNLDIYTLDLDLEKGITFKNEHGYEMTNGVVPLNKNIESEIKEYIFNVIRNNVNNPSDLPW